MVAVLTTAIHSLTTAIHALTLHSKSNFSPGNGFVDTRNPHISVRSTDGGSKACERGGTERRRGSYVSSASEVARSATERAAAGVRGRCPRKIFDFFVHFIPPRGTFGNKE